MPDHVNIMGIDAGFTATGWAVFRLEDAGLVPIAAGCVRTQPGTKRTAVRVADDDARRVAELVRCLRAAVTTWSIRGLFVELPTGGAQGARAQRAMALATGAVVAAVELLGLAAEWVTPREVKLAAAGSAAAGKDEVMAAAQRRWPELWLMAADKSRKTPAAVWEHIADAAWAVESARHGQLARALVMGGAR